MAVSVTKPGGSGRLQRPHPQGIHAEVFISCRRVPDFLTFTEVAWLSVQTYLCNSDLQPAAPLHLFSTAGDKCCFVSFHGSLLACTLSQ